MKHTHLWLIAIVCMVVAYCTKMDRPPTDPSSGSYVDSAIDRLKVLLPKDRFEKINTAAPELIRFAGDRMAVRFYEEGSNQKRFVMLRRVANDFTGVSADLSGLRKDSGGKVTGTARVTDLITQTEKTYEVLNNRVSAVQITGHDGNSITNDQPAHQRTMISTPSNPENLDDFVLQGYTSVQLYYSLYWLFGQNVDFNYCYTPEQSYLSGSYTTNFSDMEIIPVVDSPDHPIYNVQEELKCFTITSKATYTVTVNVNQPSPQKRTIVTLQSEHEVGHTYLTLQETFPEGNTIARNLGFYPMHKAKLGRETDQSSFGDDSYTPYSVSLKITVTPTEFNSLVQKITNQQKEQYNLNRYNCTTSVIDALNSINIHLPATIGSNGFFSGNNPADLGEDIRQLNLKSFSSENGGRKLTRTVSNKNDHLPIEPQGYCY